MPDKTPFQSTVTDFTLMRTMVFETVETAQYGCLLIGNSFNLLNSTD